MLLLFKIAVVCRATQSTIVDFFQVLRKPATFICYTDFGYSTSGDWTRKHDVIFQQSLICTVTVVRKKINPSS